MIKKQRLQLSFLIQNPCAFMICTDFLLFALMSLQPPGARILLMKSSLRISTITSSILMKCYYFYITRRNIREALEPVIDLFIILLVRHLKGQLSLNATGKISLLSNGETIRMFLVKKKSNVCVTPEVQKSGNVMTNQHV